MAILTPISDWQQNFPVCLLCYCNIQAGFPHGTINKGKSDDHYNGKGWEM